MRGSKKDVVSPVCSRKRKWRAKTDQILISFIQSSPDTFCRLLPFLSLMRTAEVLRDMCELYGAVVDVKARSLCCQDVCDDSQKC